MTTPVPPAIAFIVPVRNDAARLRRCLAAIRATVARSAASADLIVVDNGSTDQSPAVAHQAGATVLSLPALTVAGLRNVGARDTTAPLLAFVDADNRIDAGWLAAVGEVFDDDEVAAGGALYTAPSDGTWVQRAVGRLRGRTTGRQRVAWLPSGNLVVRRDRFLAVGGFDDRLQACEDVDLCQRLQAAGGTIVADAGLGSVHDGDPATLGALFRAERWRGRNNARVTLGQGWPGVRPLISLLIPVADLIALVACVAGLAALAVDVRAGAAAIVAGLGILVALAVVRCLRALGRPSDDAVPLHHLLAVAIVADVARALALVSPGRHHHRPATPAEGAPVRR